MKKYQIENYLRYKKDLELSMPEGLYWDEYSRDELIIKFMQLVENLARKFATSYQAIGVLTINDLIQSGNIALTLAVDKLDWSKLNDSQDTEQTLKSFLSKRIKGGIRRYIDINMSDIKIPGLLYTTMREGEQTPSIRFSYDQKIRIFDTKEWNRRFYRKVQKCDEQYGC